ncbi:MAG: polysaccharide biosynthesis tyrosine autokinase [Blastocatellia bacterium]
MSEEKKREAKSKVDRPQHATDETWLVRQSGQPPLTTLDQLSYNYNNPASSEEGVNVRDLWRKVRKRKWLILTIVIIATTIVSIESFRTKSIYQAAAKVAINRDNATVVKLGGAVLETDDSDRIRTDLLLLETYPLLEEVVVRLKLDQNPDFLDAGRRKTVVEAVTSIVTNLKGTADPASSARMVASQEAAGPLQETSRSREESERLAPYVETLRAYLIVEQIPTTRAIRIMFTHTNPSVASQVANGVAEVFVNYSFNNKTEKFNKSATWLETATRKLMAQMQQSEQELANYSRANGIFSTDEKQSLVADKLTNLYGQALKAETDRIIKQSLYEEVKQGRVSQLPEAFSDTRTGQLQGKIGDLQIRAAQLSARFGPENPNLAEVQQQIVQLEQQVTEGTKSLEGRLKADFERASRDERLIKESLERAKDEAIQQNQASIRFSILRQNVDTAKSLYNDFLQKTNQANIQLAEQNKDLRIIEPARNGALVGPRRTRAILIGLLLSLFAGIGLTLLLEYLDNTVKNVEDVMRATQLPTLALIPSMNANAVRTIGHKQRAMNKAANDLVEGIRETDVIGGLAPRGLHPTGNKVATLDALSTVVEAYRMLRTSVLLSTAGTPPKTILVTSSQPGEGKTTTAVNTAISLAQLGSSVLIIDADLRRPAVHKTFKMQNTRGLSNYLSSKTPIENLILNLPTPGLSVLPCGPIPPNPAELISSERMKDLLRQLGERYDHIIIDSPPLISVTDPVILSTMVDGSILVVQAGKSSRDLVRRARQELAGVGAKIFGVVLNNVNVKKEGYDDYYYYRYNSSYGDGQKGAAAG